MSLSRPTDRSLPLPILWVCLLSFGLAIPLLSPCSDDWPFIYLPHLAGFRGVVNFIQWLRPFRAWIFAGATALFGEHIWLYHAGLLLLRGLDALLLLWLLRLIWPQHPSPAQFAALLFAVYPAFKTQPLAVVYYPHFVVLGLLLLSFITIESYTSRGTWNIERSLTITCFCRVTGNFNLRSASSGKGWRLTGSPSQPANPWR